jgi:hypothetical protein
MSIIQPLLKGVYDKIKGAGTALTSLLANGTASIYNSQAPDGATMPYIVFSLQAGGPDNINPSSMENSVVFVRGYALSGTVAQNIDSKLDAVLRGASLSVSGYTNFWTSRESDLYMPNLMPDGKTAWMAGGLYRIRCDK